MGENLKLISKDYLSLFIQRTTEGKEIARTKEDYTEGRPPKYDEETIEAALMLLENYSYKEVSALTGISKSSLQRFRRREKNCVKQMTGDIFQLELDVDGKIKDKTFVHTADNDLCNSENIRQ